MKINLIIIYETLDEWTAEYTAKVWPLHSEVLCV
jgi:hypothetical protein